LRVLFADDHELLRDTLALFFRQETGAEPATAGDFASAREMVHRDGPFDLVVLDLDMPGMNGLAGLREAMTWEGARAVALMTGSTERTLARDVLELGASGYLPKTLPARTLANAVRFMAMGEKYAPVDYMQPREPEPNRMAQLLTRRELEVLKGIVEGKANKEIARDLDVVEPTVKMHLKALYRKLDAANRTQAALKAREAGLF
jgi:two-component system, NarL family, nitrate/nitrite response regulator NarL